MQYTRRLLTLAAVLLVSVVAVQGQDTTPPVATIAVNSSTGSNVPAFGGTPQAQPAQPTPDAAVAPETTAEAEATVEAAVPTSAPLTLPVMSDRICPAEVQYQAVPLVCSQLAADQACIAQGTVSASPRVENANFSFSQAGDLTRLTDLSELNLQSLSTESGMWSVVVANLTLNTNDPNLSTPAVVSMLLIGDVSIANAAERSAATSGGTATAEVLGSLGINVRRSPSGSAASVYQLLPGEQVTATGRLDNNEGRWIRIIVPTRFEGVGWVFGEYLSVDGDSDNLPSVREGVPVPTPSDAAAPVVDFGPMQSFNLVSGVTDASCEDTPDSGLLIQTPNGIGAGSGATLRVNGVEIVLNGTAFIQAQPNVSLRVTVLEGEASVTANGSTQQAQAITMVGVAMGQNLEPTNAPRTFNVDTPKIEALPVDLLDRSFLLDEATIAEQTSAGQQGSLSGSPDTSEPADEATDEAPAATSEIVSTIAEPTALPTCTLSAGNEIRNIRAAPDINATVASTLRAGETIESFNVVRDAKFSNVYWYEVGNGYMRYDSVQASEGCTALVNALLPSAPRPTLAPTIQAIIDLTATAQVTLTPPVPTATPGGVTLNSSEAGEVCSQANGRTVSAVQPAGAVDVAVGGTWVLSGPSKIAVTVEGVASVRNDYGDVFRLVDANGNILVRSQGETSLMLNFSEFANGVTFQLRVGAAEGASVVVRVACG